MKNGYLDTSDVSDDDLSQILGLSTNASQQDKLALQMKLANALRQGGTANGTSVPQGSVFLPPDPLTKASDIFNKLQGTFQAQGLPAQGAALDQQRQAALQKFADNLFGRKKGQNIIDKYKTSDDDSQDYDTEESGGGDL